MLCQADQAGEDNFAYPEGKTKEQATIVEYIATDQDYVKTIGLPLVAGRDFLPNSEADVKEAFLINEAAVKTLAGAAAQKCAGQKLTTSGKDASWWAC